MRIVILDGHALNPGDLSWDAFSALGECVVHERTAPEAVHARIENAEIVLTNKVTLSAELLGRLPKLRYIGVLATGYDVVDVAAAAARGITVTNVPAYGTRSVAQHTIALLLELTNHVGLHAAEVRGGAWSRSRDWCYWTRPLTELDGLTLGIIGNGRIGSAVARIADALGMHVVTVSSRDGDEAMQGLFGRSDVVSLHCPLTPKTRELINRDSLAYFKPGALLINTARGGLINEGDLAQALNAGQLGGAALDVLCSEPPPPENPLLRAANCIITPHQAWATLAARQRLMQIAAENLRCFLHGEVQNRVR